MKKAIITGGADGIGFATAKLLSENNYIVYTLDIKETKEQLDNTTHFIVDLMETSKIENILDEIGNFDLLINNAAVQIEKPFLSASKSEIVKVLNTNILSTVLLTNYALKKLNNNSLIINVGSVHSNKPRLNKLTYDISKAALDMFTKSLALELAPNIRVNQINIGATKTPMNEIFDSNPEIAEISISKVPLNHLFLAEEIAAAIFEMTKAAFKYMTGSIIIYDGGRSLV